MAEHDGELIWVEISASQRVSYKQMKQMTRAEWAELKADEDALRDSDGVLCDVLDLGDVFDGDGFESIYMVVVDENGNKVKPVDKYEDD